MSGIWSFSILTPLQRPGGVTKLEYTDEEAVTLEEKAQQDQINLRVEPTNHPAGEQTTDAYNTFWRDGYFSKVPATTRQTAQVIDPPDGHIPPLTDEGRKREAAQAKGLSKSNIDGPEDRPMSTRCIRGFNQAPPPIIGAGAGNYLNNLQIIQNSDTVAIRMDDIHEAQVIPLDKRSPLPPELQLWKGSPRGHWEGDTLVVESTNFLDQGPWNGQVTNKKHLVERWTLLDKDRLQYAFTVDDPGNYTRPWTAQYVMWRPENYPVLVEYACHEGNRGFLYQLTGARAMDAKKKAEAAK
jgi:hypothetical protein